MAKLERVEELVASLEACPDAGVREQVRELVSELMEFHGEALARVLEILAAVAPVPSEVLGELGQDPMAGSLLLLYGLHPDDVEKRVEAALEAVRPQLAAHRGDVELVGIQEGTVQLRLKGTCNGCPSSTLTFRNMIESAIFERAPEVEGIQVEGMVA